MDDIQIKLWDSSRVCLWWRTV